MQPWQRACTDLPHMWRALALVLLVLGAVAGSAHAAVVDSTTLLDMYASIGQLHANLLQNL